MDFFVELIMELIGAVWDEAVRDEKLPRIVRTVLILLLFIPVIVLALILATGWMRGGNAAGGIVGLCVVLLFLIGLIVLLRRTWR